MPGCIFCRSTETPLNVEHVIPKWARNAFNIPGRVTVSASEQPKPTRRQLGAPINALNVILKEALCESCNSGWLGGGLEKRAARILKAMAVERKPIVLDPEMQRVVALWAVKTVFLFEMAMRQMYPDDPRIEGYIPSDLELAFIWRDKAPPPRARVWLACWDCRQSVPVRYEPSSIDLPAADGSRVPAHLATFTLGYVAFQVFTVDPLAAELHGAVEWPTRLPELLRPAVDLIWPQAQPVTPEVPWPQAQIVPEAWPRLVTWDGTLRSNGMASYGIVD
jgi:hypothetical protein